MEQQRDQWKSKIGFIMAAVGSAVGLGNIWGFPYKMGMNGGFAFLIIYLLLVAFVGFAVMLGELALGRKTGQGAVGAYIALSKKYTWIGYMGVASGFLILSFYSVLGGFVGKYMISFLIEMFSPGAAFGGMGSGEFFGALINNAGGSILFHFLFMIITAVIVMGGVSGGIEKFNVVAMPALAVMLVVVIIRSVTLPGAGAGLAFMFAPNFDAFKEIGFFNVLKTAAGQMFFSLSLGMGCMITYGSYLSKKEDLEGSAFIIPISDTLMALLAGLAVMPAVFAFGMEPTGGPGLLFVTLHTVFTEGLTGFIGSLFGFIFYFLVLLAAITSAISLLEVCSTYIIDRNTSAGKASNRKTITGILAFIIFLIGIPVCMDGLGGGNIIGANFWFGKWCFLDFYDLISEGIFMPLGAMLMSIIIGWVIKTKVIKDEAEIEGNKLKFYKFWEICFKFVVPAVMVVVLIGQLQGFGIF